MSAVRITNIKPPIICSSITFRFHLCDSLCYLGSQDKNFRERNIKIRMAKFKKNLLQMAAFMPPSCTIDFYYCVVDLHPELFVILTISNSGSRLNHVTVYKVYK